MRKTLIWLGELVLLHTDSWTQRLSPCEPVSTCSRRTVSRAFASS